MLQGVQTPRLQHLPADIRSSAGVEAVELAASAGLYLDPWQQLVLDVGLSEQPDPNRRGQLRWSAREVAVVVTRQCGKGAIIEARELAGLVLFDEQLILHSAHEFKTANEAFLRIQQLIDQCDDLRRKVLRVARANGEQGIFLRNGARLRFIARSKASGRGFSGDLVVLDEAYELGAAQVGALIPTMSARPNSQMWALSSAAMATSEYLHSVRARALAGEGERLYYAEWSAPEGCDPADPEMWAMANPALGRRIHADTIQFELESMPIPEFLRERLGIPDMPVMAGGQSEIDLDVWAALADPTSTAAGIPAFVVDVSPNGKSACIAMGGSRGEDGRLHVEIVDHREGTDWVLARRSELERLWPNAVWALDPSGPAVQLRSSADWHELGAKDAGEAFAGLIAAVASSELAWKCSERDESALWAALEGARRQTYGDGIPRWSRRTSQVDISPLVALTLAVHAGRHLSGHLDPMKAVW